MRGRWLAAALVAAAVLVIPAAAADTPLRLVSQTATTITLGWDAQQDVAAWVFYANGTRVSHTFNGARASVTFAKVAGCVQNCYGVEDLRSDGISSYPTGTTPPPPTTQITQTIVNGSTIENIENWRAVYDVNADGTEDDPGSMTFSVDGIVILTEEQAPFGDTFEEGTIVVPNGVHTFLVRALSDGGASLGTSSVTATVDAAAVPPPPPPPTGFPNAANTGVPAGTTLTAYTGPSTVTAANTVIDAKTIGCITIEAANVKITRSKVTCGGFYGMRVANTNASASLLMEDSELSCNGENSHGFGERNITLRRVNLHHCENGLTVQDDVSVHDSYIHDLVMDNDAHADGMQFEGGANNVNIIHNTIFGMGSNGAFGTSAFIADLQGHSNWLIENNLFGGGAFTVYCVAGKGTNWIIRNNAFTNRFSQAAGRGNNIGYFGHSNQCGDETQSGNYILETGQQIRLG